MVLSSFRVLLQPRLSGQGRLKTNIHYASGEHTLRVAATERSCRRSMWGGGGGVPSLSAAGLRSLSLKMLPPSVGDAAVSKAACFCGSETGQELKRVKCRPADPKC